MDAAYHYLYFDRRLRVFSMGCIGDVDAAYQDVYFDRRLNGFPDDEATVELWRSRQSRGGIEYEATLIDTRVENFKKIE